MLAHFAPRLVNDDLLEPVLSRPRERGAFGITSKRALKSKPPRQPSSSRRTEREKEREKKRESSEGSTSARYDAPREGRSPRSARADTAHDIERELQQLQSVRLNVQNLLLPLRQPRGLRSFGTTAAAGVPPERESGERAMVMPALNISLLQQQQQQQQQQQRRCVLNAKPQSERRSAPSNGHFAFLHGQVKLLADILRYNGFGCVRRPQRLCESSSSRDRDRDREEVDLLWSCAHRRGQALLSLPAHRKMNFFPFSHECTHKDALARNVNLLKQTHGARHFAFMPECYVWPQEKKLLQQAMLLSSGSATAREKERDREKPLAQAWIVKPASGSQGRGISIVTSFREVNTLLCEEEEPHIVERYVQNPLLLHRKKFDLRIYVLVTSFHPLKIYVHREGLVRRASENYSFDPSSLNNKFCHLTNYSINKNYDAPAPSSRNEEEEEEDPVGLKTSFAYFNSWLENNGCTDIDDFWTSIDDLVIKTLVVVEGKINSALSSLPFNTESCFELFGFDVLIDESFQPWLMEVNFAPSLSADTALDYSVKTTVLTDMLNLIGIKKNTRSPFPTNIKSSYTEHLVTAENHSMKSDSSSSDPLSSYCKFSFHNDFARKDDDPCTCYSADLSLTFAAENKTWSSTDVRTHLHEKHAIAQFKEEFCLSTHDRRVLTDFLLEKLRMERSQNGFRLVFPMNCKYKSYRNFFSSIRDDNELLNRFVFYVSQYTSIAMSEEGAVSSNKRRNVNISSKMNTLRSLRGSGQEKDGVAFQPTVWNHIHSKWARTLGRSTSNV